MPLSNVRSQKDTLVSAKRRAAPPSACRRVIFSLGLKDASTAGVNSRIDLLNESQRSVSVHLDKKTATTAKDCYCYLTVTLSLLVDNR